MSRAITSLVLWMTPLFACRQILGIEERTPYVDAGGAGGMGEGGIAEGGVIESGGMGGDDDGCPTGTACRAPAPAGWEGPVSLDLSQEDDGECAVGTLVTGGVGLAGGVSCTPCTCGPATDETCPATASFQMFASSDGSCTGASTIITTSTSCQSFAASPAGPKDFRGEAVLPIGGSCEPLAGTATIPPAFTQWAHICQSNATPAACVDGVCAPGTGAACVYQSGQLTTCPPGPYGGDPFIVATDLVDTRACDACDCSAPEGGACTGMISGVYGSSCSGTVASMTHPSNCVTSSGAFGSKRLNLFDPMLTPGTCSPSGGEPIGEVTVGEYLTLCCAD